MTVSAFDMPAGGMEWVDEGRHRTIAIFSGSRTAVSVRFAIGMAGVLGALALPWLGLNLGSNLTAWHLTFSVASVPLLHHVSYGLVITVLALCALVSFVRAGARTTLVTRAVGWSYVLLSLAFILTTRLAGQATMLVLANDANQSQIINSQFLTNNNSPAPTTFVGIGFDSKTLVLLYAVRLGWYLLLASGLVLAGRLALPTTTPQRVAAVAGGVAVLTLVAGVTLGIAAQSQLNDGAQAVASGRPGLGQQEIASALRLNPEAAYDAQLQQALGTAQADQGNATPLADYAEAVRPTGYNLTIMQQAQLFGDALTALPASTPAGAVVRADVASFLATATISARNPNVLTLVTGQLSQPAVSYSVGRYYYEAGAESLAIRTLRRTVAETGNSEVKSIALTYIALAFQRLGDESAFRSEIVAAVKADTLNENVYAREISAGLYVPGTP